MTITTQKSQDSRFDRIRHQIERAFNWLFTVGKVGVLLLVASVVIGYNGYRYIHGEGFSWAIFVEDFYTNVSSEMLSVAITILIIDRLNQRRDKEEEKQRLMRQMGARERGLALQAVDELNALGAVKDGSLRKMMLEEANLVGAKLGRADLSYAKMDFSILSEAKLYFAKLEHADMSGVNLQGAMLTGANLRHADLVASHLEGAFLSEADLTFAKLDKANFNERTQLPDGTFWTPHADLKRFTDPSHPEYWRSRMKESPAYDRRRTIQSAPQNNTP